MSSAIKKLQEKRANGEEGFTLIELLVVIIIIGILAAIAIPVFLNQRQKGWDAAAQSDLKNAQIAQETVYTDTGSYTTSQTSLTGFNTSAGTTGFTILSANATDYCMRIVSQSTKTYFISSDGAAGAPTTVACT